MPRHRRHGNRDVGALISRIEIQKLFRTYSYDLDLPLTPNPESGKLMLLYGNNGSGKTTILNLLYHLLNPEPYGGHRSYVANVPFKIFRVYLVDGVVVTASRTKDYSAGPYNLSIKLPHYKKAVSWKWGPERKFLKGETADEKKYMEVCTILQELGLSFHYLRDTRRVEGSLSSPRPGFGQYIVRGDEAGWVRGDLPLERELPSPDRPLSPDRLLDDSVETLIQWFRQRALSATNVGYTSVNTIYRDIIKGIVKAGSSQQESKVTVPDDLTQELIELKEKNSEFARFGLTPELNVQDIVAHLKSAKPKHLPMLNTVLGPYLGGHMARLDALEELQEIMSSFGFRNLAVRSLLSTLGRYTLCLPTSAFWD